MRSDDPQLSLFTRVFHKLDEFGNNANIGTRGFSA